MVVIGPRRITGLGLAWAGLVMLVAGVVLWAVAFYVGDQFSALWGGATLVLGFLALAAGGAMLRGTRNARGQLDTVETE